MTSMIKKQYQTEYCEYEYAFYKYQNVINPQLEIDRYNILLDNKAIDTVIKNISENKNRHDPVLPDVLVKSLKNKKYKNSKDVKYSKNENTLVYKSPKSTETIQISPTLYQQFQNTLLVKLPPTTNLETLIFCILYRYRYLGMLTAIQLAVLPKFYKKFEKDHHACLELFGSAMNHTLPHFCSLFYDLENYFGSRGNYFNLVPKKGLYLLNPPFTEEIITSSMERVLDSIKKNKHLQFLITIPIWDIEGRKWVNKNCKVKVKTGYSDMPIINKLLTTDRLRWHKRYCKENYQYHDFLQNKKINAAPTYVFLIG